MEKVLIISYFFPPCNLTAGQRVMGWAEHLKSNGYSPIVVTRNWDITINTPEDVLKSSGEELKHEVNSNHEVFYLPYRASLRDRIYTKYAGSPLQKLSRIFTFSNLVLENYSTKAIPHANLYHFARKYLKENRDIKKVIISGNPFNLFYFGYLLRKELDIEWIADYRDDWNTTEIEDAKLGIGKLIQKLQAKSEKKWVGSAAAITSVSPHYVEKIARFVNKEGYVILNGYEIGYEIPPSVEQDKFVITYNGSLYPSQQIEPFLNVIGRLINEDKFNVLLYFPGLAFNQSQMERVEKEVLNYPDNVVITQRMPKEEVIEIQAKSDILLMLSHTNIKGVPSSKLYEYIGLNKPILLFPNDHDIIEDTLSETGLGIICSSENELYSTIKKLILQKQKGEQLINPPDKENIERFSRKNQTKSLVKLLDKL